MARPEKIALDVPRAVGAGQPAHVLRFQHKTVQVYGAFAATIIIEASIGGSEYFSVGDPFMAPGVVNIPETVEYLRVRVSSFTTGEAKAIFAGMDMRAW